jgi:hypothetical protein
LDENKFRLKDEIKTSWCQRIAEENLLELCLNICCKQQRTSTSREDHQADFAPWSRLAMESSSSAPANCLSVHHHHHHKQVQNARL